MVAGVFTVALCQALHSDKKGKFLVFPWKILIAYESLGRRLNLPVIWLFGLTAHCGTCSLTVCSCRRPMINCDVIGHLSCAIFICYCSHCLTFVWLHNISLLLVSVFCLPFSVFHPLISVLWSSTYISIFHLLVSVHTSLHCSLTSIFHIPSLCSFVPFLFYHFTICPLFLTFPPQA